MSGDLFNQNKYFIDAAKEELKLMDPATTDYMILDFLIKFGAGRENAKSWPEIDDFLRARGRVIRKEDFQQGLLKKSRESNFYIGSNDKGEPSGYAIPVTLSDVAWAMEFIDRRLMKEQERKVILTGLARDAFPNG
jgi:hypothetical protein